MSKHNVAEAYMALQLSTGGVWFPNTNAITMDLFSKYYFAAAYDLSTNSSAFMDELTPPVRLGYYQ